MINRRKMFGFAAIMPLAAVGVTANNAPTQAATSTKNDANAPDVTSIVLQNQQQKKVQSNDPYNTISFMSYESVGPQLGVSVGKDGHMWLKINDEWKRVKVE